MSTAFMFLIISSLSLLVFVLFMVFHYDKKPPVVKSFDFNVTDIDHYVNLTFVHDCPLCGHEAVLLVNLEKVNFDYDPLAEDESSRIHLNNRGHLTYEIACSHCRVKTEQSSNLQLLIQEWNRENLDPRTLIREE